MKVALITTVCHNVGDDFVRGGIVYLLEKVVGPCERRLIHKHLPVTVRPEWEWLHRKGVTDLFDRIPGVRAVGCSRIIDRLPMNAITDKIMGADIVVQSGAPVYWINSGSDSSQNEWYEPLIQKRWARLGRKVPLFNIGAGTCQAYESDGSEFADASDVLEFVRSFHSQCSLTTVRDRLSQVVLAHAGVKAPILPCPAFLSGRASGIQSVEGGFVALNFMERAGHYSLGCAPDAAAWQKTFSNVARRIASSRRCVLVCHNRKELALARQMLPEMESFFSSDYRDYLELYSRASCGLVNRVHAAFALAGFGRPSLVVGNDSRARMTEVIGLPSLNVVEASEELVYESFEAVWSSRGTEGVRLAALMDRTECDYITLIRSALEK